MRGAAGAGRYVCVELDAVAVSRKGAVPGVDTRRVGSAILAAPDFAQRKLLARRCVVLGAPGPVVGTPRARRRIGRRADARCDARDRSGDRHDCSACQSSHLAKDSRAAGCPLGTPRLAGPSVAIQGLLCGPALNEGRRRDGTRGDAKARYHVEADARALPSKSAPCRAMRHSRVADAE
jgi:hypothetical protein